MIKKIILLFIFISGALLGHSFKIGNQQFPQKNKCDSTNNILNKNEFVFKKWLTDTLLVLKRSRILENKTMSKNDQCLKVSEDSLSFEIRTTIDKVIVRYKDEFSNNTIIGSTLLNLKDVGAHLPKKSFELRIAYVEYFELSYENLIFEKSYEYMYVSIIPINSNVETIYSLIKGNLVDTRCKAKVCNWIPMGW